MPSSPPMAAMSTDSVTSARTMRPRLAPSDARIAVSCSRAVHCADTHTCVECLYERGPTANQRPPAGDLLILRTLLFGPRHGQGIARVIQTESDEVLIVDHGSLYPALQRLETRGFIAAEWGTSDNNRRARFYRLTRNGRKELTREHGEWRRIAAAIMRILGPAET